MNNSNFNLYKDKKILITGNTGFKGAWLSRILTLLGANVFGLSLDIEKNSLCERLQNIGIKKQFFIDIRDQKQINSFFAKNNFDGVFHLAAQPLVLESYLKPIETFEVNLMGSINILNSILKFKSTSWIVVITTDKVYKNIKNIRGFSEQDPFGGDDPYSASKAAVELAVSVWRNYFLNLDPSIGVVSVRAGNVIGGGDNAKHRLLPDIFRSFHSNSKLEIRNPNSIRPWQHVLEPLSGYLLVGMKLIKGNKISPAFNFGPCTGSKLTVLEVAKYAFERLNRDLSLIEIQEIGKSNETEYLWLDSTLAQKELNWGNRLGAFESIDWTIKWELDLSIRTPLEIIDLQIEDYFGSKL